ncbi:putative cysteine desulfurase [Pseudomonas fluorescens]|nr:putative cysteine desulfurase [Pseudomonas fluorescens]
MPFLADYRFFNHAAISPISLSVKKAILKGSDIQVFSRAVSSVEVDKDYREGRESIARLVGAHPDRVAFIQNTSIGMSMVALGLNVKPGQNVVVPDLEFPSNFLPWIQLEQQDVEVRRVAAIDGKITADALKSVVDHNTCAVALSHVQFYNGYRVDLGSIAEICLQHDALLIVDGTQSVGAIDINVELSGVDVLVVASHKWMMGPVGTGFMSFSARAFDRIKPKLVGWLSVKDPFLFNRTLDFAGDGQRFEPGSENLVGLYGLMQRVGDIHASGIKRIEARVRYLVDYLIETAHSAGLVWSNEFDLVHRSGIVFIKNESVKAEALHQALIDNKVIASVRNGGIRLSPHYHNTTDEIDYLISVTKAVR